MLRIYFTATDLANIRVAPRPDPLWELVLSMHHLRLRATPLLLASWKAKVNRTLEPGGPARVEVASLLALNPPIGYFADFLTPVQSGAGFEAGVEAILGTSRARVRAEVTLVAESATSRAAAELAGLHRGEVSSVHDLGRGLRRYREIALADHWDRIVTAFDADRTARARQLADEGLSTFLSRLHPSAHFRDSILHIGAWGIDTDRDLHLNGRGLTIIPCYFKEARQLMVLADDDLPPVLVYPIDRDLRVLAAARHTPLAELLGRNRALALEWASELTTTEIAVRLGVSAPAASKHLTVLRNAGLISSVRHHHSVLHTRTPLGRALLEGARPPRDQHGVSWVINP